ncbi:MAG: DNA-binding protein [Sphingomonadales bacterium BRH_c3]|nr:MAG: DNA-binding protein [Sphingomonadales bacterium BRH_c3]
MSASEFSRTVKLRPLPAAPLVIEASEAERAALANRFGLPRIDALTASVDLEQHGKAVHATGRLEARIVQTCAISGEEFRTAITEPLALRFVEEGRMDPALLRDDEIEIELAADDLDEIEYAGDSFDLGEAVAQSLGLAIDTYAEGPNAERVRQEAGISSDDAPSGPLAEALKGLKRN